MTATERATAFVNRYPAMFTEDKEFWINVIEIEILKAQIEIVQTDTKELKQLLRERESRC